MFSIRSFKLNDSLRTFVTFDICAQRDMAKFNEYGELIRKMNPKGELKALEVFYNEAPKVELPNAKDLGIVSSCSKDWVTDEKFSCSAFAIGEHRADRLSNYFSSTQGLLSAQYLKYQVDGVEQDDAGHFTAIFKEYNAIVYVRGLADFPQLFGTEWKP